MELDRLDHGLLMLQRWAADDWRPPPPFTVVELLRLTAFVAECRLLAVEEAQHGLVRWLAEIQQTLRRAMVWSTGAGAQEPVAIEGGMSPGVAYPAHG